MTDCFINPVQKSPVSENDRAFNKNLFIEQPCTQRKTPTDYFHLKSNMSRCGNYLAVIVSKFDNIDADNEMRVYKLTRDNSVLGEIPDSYLIPVHDNIFKNANNSANSENYCHNKKSNLTFQKLAFEDTHNDYAFVDFSKSDPHHILVASTRKDQVLMFNINEAKSSLDFLGKGGISSDRHQFQGMGLTLFEKSKGLFKEYTDKSKLSAVLNLDNDAVITADQFGAVD